MRRWFLALMALFVAAQMSWAGAQLCCVAELSPQQTEQSVAAHDAAPGEAQAVCETGHCHCHHAGCAAPLDEQRAHLARQAAPPEPAALRQPKSHIPAGLERPDWLRA